MRGKAFFDLGVYNEAIDYDMRALDARRRRIRFLKGMILMSFAEREHSHKYPQRITLGSFLEVKNKATDLVALFLYV